jgi:sulfate transport system permease protein
MPLKTEIAPLMIMTKLEQYDYAGATAVAAVMLIVSLFFLFTINIIQGWSQKRGLRSE